MKNNKLLMVAMLGLAFGVVSQVEAFRFLIDNNSLNDEGRQGNLRFGLSKTNLPKSVGTIFAMELEGGSSVPFREINSNDKSLFLEIYSAPICQDQF